jgi:NAD(P)H dehydrogenase (quinone)
MNVFIVHAHSEPKNFIDMLPPFVAYSPARIGDTSRAEYLALYRQRLLTLETTSPIEF